FSMMLFFYLTFMGACSGSTSGGLKIFRFQVAYVLLRANLQQLVHPRAVIKQQYNNHNLDEDIVRSLITFSFFFTITIGIIALGLALIGLDWVTALTGAATAVCNVGPGLGPIIGPAGNFASLPDSAKWLLTIGMLLGRLEILTVFVLVTRAFWRH
ncbi:potassium transporter TrkG, partial [Pseudomonas sp.]